MSETNSSNTQLDGNSLLATILVLTVMMAFFGIFLACRWAIFEHPLENKDGLMIASVVALLLGAWLGGHVAQRLAYGWYGASEEKP